MVTSLTPPTGVTDSNFPAYKLEALFANFILLLSILLTIYLPSSKIKLVIDSSITTLPLG